MSADIGVIHVPCPECGRLIPVTGRIVGDADTGMAGDPITMTVKIDQDRLSETVASHKAEHHFVGLT